MRALRFIVRQLLLGRFFFLLAAYAGLLALSLFLAYQLRFDFEVPMDRLQQLAEVAAWVIPLKLVLLFSFGQFGVLLSYFRLPDVYRIATALGLTSAFMVVLYYATDPAKNPPRSVILSDLLLSLFFLAAFRTLLRVIRERYLSTDLPGGSSTKVQRVAIVGAGDVGATVAGDLLSRRGLGMRPVIFLDDDRSKWRRQIHGIPVVDSPDSLAYAKERYGLDSIIIAMPSAPAKRIREVIANAQQHDIKAEIVPSLAELTTGRVKASRVRPVDIEDLLGRDEVQLDSGHIAEMIRGRVVLVTGAGGSIGSELCRQVASHNPKRLVLIEQAEIALFNVENALKEDGFAGITLPLIADILDAKRIRGIFERYRPQIVFHAAAHKHVPIMENQPSEAIKNNTFGTARLADIAAEYEVERFVFISTDKAINPTNVMGASKRLAEIFLQARQREEGTATRFMAVRFGNVLGSSGSVVPVFRKQIAAGGPVTVTHPEVTRYFMTIPEAVGLVLQCATQGEGGEIFVLDMGTPVKIVDLARQMIQLSGFRPDIDIEIKFIGLRPGEKLFEELQHDTEAHTETSHPRIFRFVAEPKHLDATRSAIENLALDLDKLERNAIKDRLRDLIPEYSPFLD